MDLDLSPEERAFRDEVRAFLDAHLTEDLRRAGRLCAGVYADRPVAQRWLKILDERGWAAPAWPVEYGGADWTAMQHYIFASELAAAGAPPVTPNATRMVGPMIVALGTPEQKARYLPRIRSGEDWWAQGYSEPEAGSDLAALRCRAVRDGDDYVLNGSKIWTTHAQWSNKMFCLVRTNTEARPQAGISFLLLDMDTPGIQVRPIITLSGDHEVNQVFFDNARVPVSGLLGGENDGWTIAKHLLTFERGGHYSAIQLAKLENLRRVAAQTDAGGKPLDQDPAFAAKLAHAAVALESLQVTELRIAAALKAGQSPGPASSLLKIRGTEIQQLLTELHIEAAGAYAAPFQPAARDPFAPAAPIGPSAYVTAMPRYLNDRAASIYAGSNEIQRNIIGAQMLGLRSA